MPADAPWNKELPGGDLLTDRARSVDVPMEKGERREDVACFISDWMVLSRHMYRPSKRTKSIVPLPRGRSWWPAERMPWLFSSARKIARLALSEDPPNGRSYIVVAPGWLSYFRKEDRLYWPDLGHWLDELKSSPFARTICSSSSSLSARKIPVLIASRAWWLRSAGNIVHCSKMLAWMSHHLVRRLAKLWTIVVNVAILQRGTVSWCWLRQRNYPGQYFESN